MDAIPLPFGMVSRRVNGDALAIDLKKIGFARARAKSNALFELITPDRFIIVMGLLKAIAAKSSRLDVGVRVSILVEAAR
jgi:hypothetical protein